MTTRTPSSAAFAQNGAKALRTIRARPHYGEDLDPFCFVPNSRDIEPVSALANQVSAKQIRIWTIREWRLGAEIARLALSKRTFTVAETDSHSHNSLKSGAFS
jgi:hypothetical protein